LKILFMIGVLLLAGSVNAANLIVCPSRCDYESIQAAVYAAKLNDTIELQSGTYNESVHLTKELKFIGNKTGKGEPIVTGNLYTEGYRYSLIGFGFNSVRTYYNPYSVALNSVEYWIAMSNQYYSTKSYAKALEASSNALIIDPQNVIALNLKGNALAAQGRISEAIGYYDQALRVDTSSSTSWSNKANALLSSQNYELALACCDRAINSDPRQLSYLITKVLILSDLAKYDDALSIANKAIEMSPLTFTTWMSKAVVLLKMGKLDDAITAINKAIDLNPSEGTNWQMKGAILRLQGKNSDADAAFTKARELGYKG